MIDLTFSGVNFLKEEKMQCRVYLSDNVSTTAEMLIIVKIKSYLLSKSNCEMECRYFNAM